MKFLQKQTGHKNVSMIDGHLVLSLTELDDPIIWRMSLEEIGSAIFSIKNTKTKTSLILKKSDKTTEEIAVFKDRDMAAEILSSISDLLTQKKTSQNSGGNQTITTPKKEASKWFIALFLVIIIIALYYYLITLMPQRNNDSNPTPSTTSSAPSGGGTGQPIDADEFLRGL